MNRRRGRGQPTWRRKNRRRRGRGSRRQHSVSNSSNLITPLSKNLYLSALVGQSFTNVPSAQISLEISGVTDISSTFSTQPSGFQQWMQFYKQYQVVSVALRCEFVNNSTDQLVVAVYPSTSATPLDTVGEASLLPLCREANIPTVTGFKPLRTNTRYHLRSLYGHARSALEFVGSASDMPTAKQYVHIIVNSADVQLQLTDITIRCTLKFQLRLFNRRDDFLSLPPTTTITSTLTKPTTARAKVVTNDQQSNNNNNNNNQS